MIDTLDSLTKELEKQGMKDRDEIQQKLHHASMLAFIESANAVMKRSTMPTPLYRFTYDSDSHNLQFETLEGRARVPKDNSFDMNMFDILVATLLREKMPVLVEGKTGIGKTWTAEQFAKTVLHRDNYVLLRLNNNMSNVFQPYTEGYIENGIVKIKLRKDQAKKVGMLIVDESNRGDTNQILQLQDGVIRLSSGEGTDIGMSIPEYNGKEWVLNDENLRPTFMISAQNPAATKDAKYSQTKRTDAAQNNRNLQIDMPNSAARSGASILLLDTNNGYHKAFLEEFRKNIQIHLGTKVGLDKLADEWSAIYAFATDPKKTECTSIKSAIEFMDMMTLMTSTNIKREYEIEKQDIKDWNVILRKYGVNFDYTSTLDENAQGVMILRKITQLFEEEYVPRDSTKVKKLSDAISTMRRIKKAFSSDNPIDTYADTPNYITVQDMACGYAILLHDKQDKHDEPDTNPVGLIDTVLKEYIDITGKYAQAIGYKKPFNAEDEHMAVYNLAFQHAVTVAGKVKVKDATDKKRLDAVEEFVKDIGASVSVLKRLETGDEYRKPLVARMIADLTTLAGFADQNADNIGYILGKTTGTKDATKDLLEKMSEFKEYVKLEKLKFNSADIYMQRLTRVIGA